MSRFDLIPADGKPDRDQVLKERESRVKPFAKSYKEFAANYAATSQLRSAVNVALSLGRPLLLTGEPGSGKTLAAYWIADRLSLEERVYEFNVKSDSRARDVCYEFDAVSWYRESQISAANKAPPVAKKGFLSPGPLGKAFGWGAPPELPSVVLIDEIDKAPRDFPNDLLLELDQMRFTIVETGESVICPPDRRPIIVITSNAERRLPDPFLRRCIIHRIEIDPVVPKILEARLKEFGVPDAGLIQAAGKFWIGLSGRRLTRKPSIDEFWRWLALATSHGAKPIADITAALSSGGAAVRDLPFVDTLFASADLDEAARG